MFPYCLMCNILHFATTPLQFKLGDERLEEEIPFWTSFSTSMIDRYILNTWWCQFILRCHPFYPTSNLVECWTLRWRSLYDVNKKLPKAPKGAVALPEGAFWLLVTGQEPTEEEVPFFWEMFCRKKERWKHYQKGFGWIILAFRISVDAFGILWCLGMNWFSVPKLTLRDAFVCIEKMVSANLNTMAWRFAQ